MDTKNEVKVIGFISSEGSSLGDNPIPSDYMCDTEVPNELINELKKFGSCDEIGNIYFPKDFHPDPVKDEKGDVWLSINSSAFGKDIGDELMMKAISMLDEAETTFPMN